MRCPYCGHENPNNAKKCERCGRRLDDLRERRQEKRILLYGIVLIALILAAGIGAMFGMSHILDVSSSADNSPQKVTIVSTPTPTEAADSTETVTADSAAAEEAVTADSAEDTDTEDSEEELAGELVDSNRQAQITLLGYSEVNVSSSSATSTIYQEGVDNSPYKLYDHEDWSSWQDGVDGDGIGESITFNFDKTYKIKFLTFRLGNWYSSDDYYYRNNRPETITFDFGEESCTVTFPDEKTEFCVELNHEVETSTMKMTINSVYKGTEYEDTCINEVTVYGFVTGDAAVTTDTTASAVDTASTTTTDTAAGTDTTATDTTTTDAGTTDTTYGTTETYGDTYYYDANQYQSTDTGTTDSYYSDGGYSEGGY